MAHVLIIGTVVLTVAVLEGRMWLAVGLGVFFAGSALFLGLQVVRGKTPPVDPRDDWYHYWRWNAIGIVLGAGVSLGWYWWITGRRNMAALLVSLALVAFSFYIGHRWPIRWRDRRKGPRT